ncbi:MAG: hypothetical protein KC470_12480 [Dehalococcoidia bacterium]|nr:hypothetical protein [Dehalococcoidia bacterium]
MTWLRRLQWVAEHPAIGVYVSPVLLAAGFYLAISGPEWWGDWFFDHGLSFLMTFWMGSGFAFMWRMMRRGAMEIPGGELTVAVAGIGGIVLVAGIGVFTDRTLFAVAIWPGLLLASRAASRLLLDGEEEGDRERTA